MNCTTQQSKREDKIIKTSVEKKCVGLIWRRLCMTMKRHCCNSAKQSGKVTTDTSWRIYRGAGHGEVMKANGAVCPSY